MALTLRPYQNAAIKRMVETMPKKDNFLMELPTGAGKTIIFSAFVHWARKNWKSSRLMILAHREQLVRQAADKLLKVAPELKDELGLACASIGHVDMDKSVIVGSVQTVARRLAKGDTPKIDVLIVDEVHRMPPIQEKEKTTNQYQDVITTLRKIRPGMRLVGVTATPYIMGHGHIYGEEGVKPGERNWFDELDYEVKIGELIREGFLVPFRAKQLTQMKSELEKIGLRGGEYVNDELSSLMRQPPHLQEALLAYQKYHEGRRHTVAFCVDIRHAEELASLYRANGISSVAVHSQQKQAEREKIYADFAAGKIDVLCNVRMLTEGWDCPQVDCILLCCPTRSTPLYIQEIGRGLRLSPGKSDCLVLDMAENCITHGDPCNMVWKDYQARESGDSEPLQKTCPECKRICHLALIKCPECGYVWPREEKPQRESGDGEMEDVNFKLLENIEAGVPYKVSVASAHLDFKTTKKGKPACVLQFVCINEMNGVERVNYYLFPGKPGTWQYKLGIGAWKFLLRNERNIPAYPKTMNEIDAVVDKMADPPELFLHRVQGENRQFSNVFAWVDGKKYVREEGFGK